MPLKLYEPGKKNPNFRVRGTYLGVRIDQSTGTRDRRIATQILRKIRTDIESGAVRPADLSAPTFAGAALAYMQATGVTRFMEKLLLHFGETPLADIDQLAIDAAAEALYPGRSPATRNRQVYTLVVAILNHAGMTINIRRPKGAQGRELNHWLWPEQAQAVFEAAAGIDEELACYLVLFAATGLRLSEVLAIRCADLRLQESFLFVPDTKNGEPQPVHLPPAAVAALANHPRGLDRGEQRLFRWHKGGALYKLVRRAFTAAHVDPKGQPHHIFRHSFATWMRRYAGADPFDLQRWKSRKSAARYTHAVASESARLADKLPLGKK